MSFDDRLSDYNDVASRIAEFRVKHPEGSLQPVDPAKPFEVVTIADKTFVWYVAAAYRSPDDQRPGIGVAWEPFPGRTPYTRDSEVMVLETSAWGRAIVAALAADTKKGIASAEEVRNRRAEDEDWDAATPATAGQARVFDGFVKDIAAAPSKEAIAEIGKSVHMALSSRAISKTHYDLLATKGSARLAELEGS